MSSILKALKKLEEERTGRPDAAVTRSGGQFVAPAGSRRNPLRLLAAGIGVGLLLAVGLFMLLRESQLQNPVSIAPPAAPPAPIVVKAAPPPQQPAAAPPGPAVTPGAEPVRPRVALPVSGPALLAPVRRVEVSPTPASPVAIPPALPRSEPARSAPLAAAASPATPDRVEQVRVDHREIPRPGQQWAAPQLAVSDILPASGGGRMAIVNGLPVMEGTLVENALVEEILADRVRFVIDGKAVEVRVNAGQ